MDPAEHGPVDGPVEHVDRPHPAKFSAPVLETLCSVVERLALIEDPWGTPFKVLDPFGGIGGVFALESIPGVECFMYELEEEWASQAPAHRQTNVIVGDSLELMREWITENHYEPDPDGKAYFDAIVTSPVYGNRMADHHEAKDESKRHTYRHYLGRPLTDGSAAGMQWGTDYRAFHLEAWRLATEMVRDGGWFVLNVSDHIRKRQRERVALWHLRELLALGWTLVDAKKVSTRRQRMGANGLARVDGEMVYVLQKR